MRLLGLHKDCFSNWWDKLPDGTTMIVQPKIEGLAIGLRYKYGQLVNAYSRENNDVIENIRTINAIPLSIDDSLKVEVEIEGVLYTTSSHPLISADQLTFALNLGIVSTPPFYFLAFQIFRSKGDELTDLTQLQKWGFEIPITLRTDDPRQVRMWHSQWINNQLFSNFPTNGIVAKCNSSSTKNSLGDNASFPNWALALTR
tara:strand:+ start:195 stop:797 length:603 start_codon:yes stop_codon:yes gene_type:complete